jgi:KDO2-lipid IV(A) lauroyltransferase
MLRIIYYPIYAIVWLISWLPLSILYLLSDLIFILVFYVVRYRRKVVQTNLVNSFPDKSLKEINKIKRQFYLHFCDIFIETIKILHISEKELKKRMKFNNAEVVNQRLEKGENVILMFGHYCNWEYMLATRLYMPNPNFVAAGVYRKVNDRYIDAFYLKVRSRFNLICIEKNNVFREIIKYRKLGTPLSMGLNSDQTPSLGNIHYWTNFLNQDTAVLMGAERIARQTGYVVYYVDIRKVKRGCCEADLILLSDDVKNTPEFEVTEKYMRLMEQTILRNPAYWLWTHRRWKHKREDVTPQN